VNNKDMRTSKDSLNLTTPAAALSAPEFGDNAKEVGQQPALFASREVFRTATADPGRRNCYA